MEGESLIEVPSDERAWDIEVIVEEREEDKSLEIERLGICRHL